MDRDHYKLKTKNYKLYLRSNKNLELSSLTKLVIH